MKSSSVMALLASAGLAGWLTVGCAKVMAPASGTGATTGTGGVRGTGTGGSGSGTGTGTGGTVGDGGFITADVSTGICQEGMYMYKPQIPTVFMLVDQSGSMWKCRTSGGAMDATGRECANHADSSWYPLRDGVLQVLQQLQADVRFGFASFTGEQGQAMCPTLNPVAPALNAHTAIAANYNALVAPTKGETPTRKALEQVTGILRADTAPGDKFVLFVTDGEPDFCDDGNALCPPDSVIGQLQTMQAAGVKTLVMGISSPLTTISDAVLQGFANAGAGQPVAPPYPGTQMLDLNAFYDQCNGVAGWRADYLATGKPDMRNGTGAPPWPTIGNYTTPGGTAPVYKPDVSNRTALVNEISRALSGVKSCTFDLNNLDGKMLRVDMTMLNKVTVKIMGSTIPLDATNGWRMNSASELELVGGACETWRMPQNMNIDIQIPCAVIIIG